MSQLLQVLLVFISIIYYGLKKNLLLILCLIKSTFFYCILNFISLFFFNYFKIYNFYFFIKQHKRKNININSTSISLVASGKRFFSSSANKVNSNTFDLKCFNLNNSNHQCKAIIKSKKSKLYNSRCTYNAKFDNFCGKHKNYNLGINIKQTNLKQKCVGSNKKGVQCGCLTSDIYCFHHTKNILLNKTDSFKNELLNAKTLDQFYTNESVVNFCIQAYNNCVKINKDKDIFIEPSAGSGAFISSINRMCNNNVFIDIDPKHTSIKKTNFLDFNENLEFFDKIHIIGNPPFKLINKFIKKSSQIADVIGFILPLSFRKESRKRLFPLNFHCIYDTILPSSYFFFGKSISKIPTVFQI